jgi:hypothetical protein
MNMRIALLSFLPSMTAALGAALDEYQHLGFTTWRSVCRAGEISLGSILAFTWQLLPNAIVGLLLGGLALQATGFVLRHREHATVECAAAHIGCVVAMPLGLLLCAQSMPPVAMPFVDGALAAASALLLLRLLSGRHHRVRVHP